MRASTKIVFLLLALGAALWWVQRAGDGGGMPSMNALTKAWPPGKAPAPPAAPRRPRRLTPRESTIEEFLRQIVEESITNVEPAVWRTDGYEHAGPLTYVVVRPEDASDRRRFKLILEFNGQGVWKPLGAYVDQGGTWRLSWGRDPRAPELRPL